jgi:UDP:flavonoid glycosyltransferase YjiC (YdhE family)
MKILFTPYGGGSIAHTVRSLAVADELKRRGHSILFTAPTKKRALIEKAGYEVFGTGHPEVNLIDVYVQSIEYFHTHRKDFLAWLQDEIDAAESFKPDIIVNSPTFFGAHVAEKLGIPHITLINAQWLTEYKGILGLSFSHDHIHHRALRRLAQPIFKRKFEKVYLKEIQSFYEELGIAKQPKTQHDLHKHYPVIIPSIPEIEPVKRKSRGDIHYVGPLVWQGFEQEDLDIPALYPSFDKKPFIYVSLGGSIFRKESYTSLINALLKKTEWNILFTLGPNFPREDFPADTDHLKIRNFAPGLKACEYADIIINTARHGTVMQALWHGKPVVGLPHNIDQATIASRLTELGAGTNLNKIKISDFTNREHYFKKATSVSPELIIKTTERALKNPKLRANAQKIRDLLRQYDRAAEKAADIIEHYAQKS